LTKSRRRSAAQEKKENDIWCRYSHENVVSSYQRFPNSMQFIVDVSIEPA
jgi:hypothetical protein